MKHALALVLLIATWLYAEVTVSPRFAIAHYFAGSYDVKVDNADLTQRYKATYGDYKFSVGATFSYSGISLYFDAYTYATIGKKSFAPLLTEFYSGVSYKLTESVTIKYEHLCIHPFRSLQKTPGSIFGGYDMIGISYGY
jgi:hypothetical protein